MNVAASGAARTDNIEDIYPLSPLQEGLLYHSLLTPESRFYFCQVTFTMQGDLDVQAFTQAWQDVVDRHPTLRTCFVWERRERPLQVVWKRVNVPLAKDDWRGLDGIAQQTRLESARQVDLARGFDLTRAPLLRLALFRLEEDLHAFMWSFHHILFDGWSMFLIFNEIFRRYAALANGAPLDATASRPYSDFIAWQRQQDLSKAEVFWRRTLSGFATPTPLVVDRRAIDGSPLDEGFDTRHVEVEASTTAALQAMARQHRITLNTLVLGAWGLLMARYSGDEDVVVGATVSGRPPILEEAESRVGLFINTLPVRVQAPGERSLMPWLRELQAHLVELREYEYSPLVDVQGWSDVPRGLPLFESLLLFENYRKDASLEELGGALRIGDVQWFERTHYPLMVLAVPDTRLLLRIAYHTHRFDTAAITRMLGHWRTLLEGMVTNPDRRLSELPLLTDRERHQALVVWNATSADYPRDRGVHHLFAAQAERTPDAVAVVCDGERVTYRELDRRSNQVAHHLRTLGVGAEVLVGIAMRRSVDMVVGLLGILKAGGAYVPLDPAHPKERLAFMLADAKVPVLLTQASVLADLPKYGGHVTCLDRDSATIAREPAEVVFTDTSATNLAYVIYTSGSTGRPKGVAVTHRSLVNFLSAMRRAPGLTAADVLVSVTTLSFDIAGLELYLPLIVGARVVLVSREVASDGARLMNTMAECGATVMQATPATWRLLIEAGWEGNSCLKILCGGEALPEKLAVELRRRGASMWNLYGPTETTVWSTVSNVEPENEIVCIGRPIANTQVYVLDRHLHPVPVGVFGELYIGGEGLARGYLHRADLTAERFVPNPFGGEPGTRLYRTGDTVRYRPDGALEFLGRSDDQVKIRGYRIELGEIESALIRHPGVRQAVVSARGDGAGEKRLVAYVVPTGEPALTAGELRRFVAEKIPDYMVPAAVVMLEALPLTPNGKVDRRALPAPDGSRPESDIPFVGPRTAIESAIANIWRDLLGIDEIGVYDNFFDLGGHSLLAMRMIARLENTFGVRINPIDLALQTLAQLAALCDEQPQVVPESPRERRPRGLLGAVRRAVSRAIERRP